MARAGTEDAIAAHDVTAKDAGDVDGIHFTSPSARAGSNGGRTMSAWSAVSGAEEHRVLLPAPADALSMLMGEPTQKSIAGARNSL
jgi:hypothetical protein